MHRLEKHQTHEVIVVKMGEEDLDRSAGGDVAGRIRDPTAGVKEDPFSSRADAYARRIAAVCEIGRA